MRPGLITFLASYLIVVSSLVDAQPKRVVFITQGRSHGYGSHEYYAGAMLLARLLRDNVPGMKADVFREWPEKVSVLRGAAALWIGCDNGRHLVRHREEIQRLADSGVGLAVIHYALTVPKGPVGDAMLDWIGGYYETYWSVNPTWEAHFTQLPDHPITRGVRPFSIQDEWYYHMCFRPQMEGVTPILTAVPPDGTRRRPDGPHSNNPVVRARMGMAEHVAWAYQRPGGGRGFGFTGMHRHWNWAHDDYRKLMLNALVWLAGGEVPAGGVPSSTPTLSELQANLDEAVPANWKPQSVLSLMERFRR